MQQERPSLFTHDRKNFCQFSIAGCKVVTLHLTTFDTGKSLNVFEGIHRAHLAAMGRDIPFIILHKKEDG